MCTRRAGQRGWGRAVGTRRAPIPSRKSTRAEDGARGEVRVRPEEAVLSRTRQGRPRRRGPDVLLQLEDQGESLIDALDLVDGQEADWFREAAQVHGPELVAHHECPATGDEHCGPEAGLSCAGAREREDSGAQGEPVRLQHHRVPSAPAFTGAGLGTPRHSPGPVDDQGGSPTAGTPVIITLPVPRESRFPVRPPAPAPVPLRPVADSRRGTTARGW